MPNTFPVYVVDDQEPVRALLTSLCDEQGWWSRTFESGTEFLDEAPQLPPGCILLDMRLPGLRGIHVQAELSQRALPFAVIAITGHGDVELAVESMKLGAIDFIEKPFETEVLLSAIRTGFSRLARRTAN